MTLPRPCGAAAAAVIAGSLWGTARRARLREGDDCSAVQRWVDSMIIGLRLCPYAQPAREAGRLRVVSSDGTTGLAVLDDIVAEAEMLAATADEVSATTTLMACPDVPEWQDFAAFHEFYTSELQSGRVLSRNLGLDVFLVAFHPDCVADGEALTTGDEVAVQRGEDVLLAVVEEEDPLTQTLSVQLLGRILESSIDSEDGAEDLAVEAFDEPEAAAVRSSNVLWSLATTPGDGAATRRSALGKAPRPVLHLLRTQDLATVDAASREEVYRHNDACLQEMGLEAFEQKLRSCS